MHYISCRTMGSCALNALCTIRLSWYRGYLRCGAAGVVSALACGPIEGVTELGSETTNHHMMYYRGEWRCRRAICRPSPASGGLDSVLGSKQ
jgi:hypothetical protein